MDLRSNIQKQNCVVCLNQICNQVFLDQCKHSFCFACIQKWSEKSHSCPQCRTIFQGFYEQQIDPKIDIKRYEASPIINNKEDKRLMALADIDNSYYDLVLQQIDSI
ncbi:unnamed protein product [Paramecium sonneborni]|uniref:RING-type E3 ubiquitin transferase n=1 Tax=Paramecium sonneborni TaxID=65129 RepID=A0A8S1JWS7_9CILI|nr:unnamed protein product [Paramecium sonneborni]